MSHKPEHFTVWSEIPVADLQAGMAYYGAVLDAEFEVAQMGPNKTAIFQIRDIMSGISGHLYEGTPAKDGSGPTIHLQIQGTLEDAMARTTKAGGKVISEPVTIPPGRFAYTTDPDGNSIGLFEAA